MSLTSRRLARSSAGLCLGLFIMALGIALVTNAQLGTTAISSIPYVLSLIYPLSFGTFTFLLNILFVLLQKVLLGKLFGFVHVVQLPVILVFSVFIDIAMWMTSPLVSEQYICQLILVVAGSLVLGLGISIEIASNSIVLPGEGVVLSLAWRCHKAFGPVKILFDMSQVSLAFVISLSFLHLVAGLREGTLLSAVLVGWSVRLCSRWTKRLSAYIG